jgi:glycosyltransferase involved in cell wall biosynthesis
MKISYVTTGDVKDVHAWSGLIFHIFNALQVNGNDVECIDKLRCKPTFLSKIRYAVARLRGKKYLWQREFSIAKSFATEILERIDPNTDVIFSAGSLPIALLKTNKKIVFYADANFVSMVDYYEWFSNLSKRSIMLGNTLEKQALENCDLAIYSSDWAAQSAIKDYGINPQKVKVVPFGANIECSRTEKDVEAIFDAKSKDVCNLLFVGVDWERKGGNIALEAAKILHEKGVNVCLDIVGVKDCPVELPNYVVNHGFISKSTEEGKKKINGLFEKAHFFLLPTRAECFGVVFSEAASFGLPSISTKTGGIATVINDNINGKTFDLSSSPTEYADYITDLFNNPTMYRELALSSFHDYKNRLNWEVSGQAILELIKNI